MSSESENDYTLHFKYYLNFWCVFEHEEIFSYLGIGVCVLEMTIAFLMLKRSRNKADEMIKPSAMAEYNQTYCILSLYQLRATQLLLSLIIIF